MELSLAVETREFEAYIAKLTRGMEPEVLKKTLVRTAFDFVAGVVKMTPKLTGRAAGGWTPWTDHAGRPVPVTGSSGTGIAEGKSEGSYQENLRGPNQYVEMTNGVPYIVRLEYGWSQKGTAAVRINMRRIREKISKNAQMALSEQIRDADFKTRGMRG